MSNSKDYNSLFYHNPLPNWVYDRQSFEILDVNQSALDLYGYSREEFLAMTIKDLRPKSEIPKVLAAHTGIDIREGNIYFGVFTHKKKSGELIRMEINGHKVRFQDRDCIMVSCQDVTVREKQFKDLEEFSKKLNAASEIAKLGYWKLEMDANTLSWSDRIYEIWGRKKEDFEVSFSSFFETIHPDDQAIFEEEHKLAFSGVKELNFSHRISLPDGKIKWVRQIGRLNKNEKGEPVSFEGTVQDITVQKQEEQHLKLLESVITHSHDAILITEAEPFDEPGPKIIYVNEAFTKMTGYTAEEVIGKSPRILQGPNSDRKELARLSRALRNWESCEITTINYKKNGEEFWINFSVSPVADENGWYTHWIAIEREITEQKNKELENKLLSQISQSFNEAGSFFQAANQLCQIIGEYGKYDVVELWSPNIENTHFQFIGKLEGNPIADRFYDQSLSIQSIEISAGLQGQVWRKKSPILLEKINESAIILRQEAAKSAGLNSILGIPITHNDELVSILVLGTGEGEEKLTKYERFFKKLDPFLGSEISRKKLEGNLSHLYDAIPDLICLADFQGRFLRINKAGCDLLGYEKKELLFHSFDEFVHPEERSASRAEFMKLSEGNRTFQFENRYIRKDGEIIWLIWTCNSDLNEGLVYASAKNISQEKRLRELNKQASRLAKIGSWEIDIVFDKLYWSEIVHEIHETDPKRFVPNLQSGINFYREDFRSLIRQKVEDCIQKGDPFDFEAVLVTAKRNEKWVRVFGNAEFLNGKCIRIYGSFQDIHASKSLENQISEILGSISDAFCAVDQNWNFTYFNTEAEKLLQRKSDDVLGNNIWEEFAPARGTMLEEVYRRVAETGVSETFEYLYPGNGCWYEINTYPSNGGLSTYFKNIDERKKAERRLKNAFEEKNRILESIGDAFFALDKDWTVTYWNRKAEEIIGIRREDLIGYNLWEKFPEAKNMMFFKQYQQSFVEQVPVSFQEYIPLFDQWFEANAYPTPEGISVFFRDITLQKKAEKRILEANERFEMVTQVTTDAIWDWDIENKVFVRGEGFEKLFGYQIEKKMREEEFWKDSFHPDDLPRIQESLEKCLADPSVNFWEKEYRIIHQTGEVKNVIDKGLIIRNKKGLPIRMVGAITDISERIKYEQELEELNLILKEHIKELQITNEHLEQFAFIASHDLQEPLRMISSFLNQLERKYGDQLDDKARQYIHFAIDGAKRMKQIILDLLDYSRAGKVTEEPELVDLNEMMREFKILRRKAFQEKGVRMNVDPLPVLKGFKAPLTQTFHCLLDNAIKYSREEEPPEITLSVKEEKSQWRFQIADNGIGIDPKFFDKIFIIFQRLHDKDTFSGTGIGLSIAKKQVEFMGGNIWVESTPGEGSTFYFTLPKLA